MKENYSKVPIFPSSILDWPSHIGKHLQYTNLAMIEQDVPLSQAEFAEFYCHNSLLGKVDRIVAKKRKIEFEDMLQSYSSASGQEGLRILVNGAPGVGKTTFSRKICKDWESGCVQALHRYDLVVLLELRERRLARAKKVDELFPHPDPMLHKQVVNQIKKSGGENILLIIDGYDELGNELKKESLYQKIVDNEVLPKSTVIITCRQYAAENLLQNVHRQVEILGFSEEDIENSIAASIANKDKAAALCQLLKQRQDLSTLCYIPLVCAIVVHVYMEAGYSLPNTLTDLYTQLVINLAKRQAKRWNDRSLSVEIKSLNSLPQPSAYQLGIISEMAYNYLIGEKLVFYHDELDKLPFYSHEKESHTLGLITTVNSYTLYDDKLNYQFIHLTVQEYLAAWWIVNKLSKEEQGEFFNKNQQNDRLRLVLVFLAGLSKLDAPQYSHVFQCKIDFTDKTDFRFLKFDHSPKEEHKLAPLNYHLEAQRLLLLLLFLHEAQNSKLCHTLSEAVVHSTIDLRRARLTLFHCMALGYFLGHSSCSWKALNLPIHGLSDQSIHTLTTACSISAESSVQCLTFSMDTKFPVSLNDFSQNVVSSIVTNAIFSHCQEIRLSYEYSPEGEKDDTFASLLSLPKLETLSLSRGLEDADTNYKNMIEFGKQMKSTTSLRVLNLYKCGLDSYALQLLVDAVKVTTTLEELDLCCNNITGEGSFHLFNVLRTNTTVKHLDLTCNPSLTTFPTTAPPLLNQSLEALEEMLSVNNCLEYLALDGCGLAGIAVESVARGLAFNSTLKYLSIDAIFSVDANLGVLSAPDLAGILATLNVFKALQINSSLKQFSFTFRLDRELECVETLGDSIEHMLVENKHIECLSLSLLVGSPILNLFDLLSYLEKAIATGLTQNSVLSELYVYGELFTPMACIQLFSILKKNQSLKKLCIDAAYGENVAEAVSDMLACNTSLLVLDMCYSIHTLRDRLEATLTPGLELPQSLKTDRGEPDIEPFVRGGLEQLQHCMNLKEEVQKMRKDFVAQGLVKNPSDPIPLTLSCQFGITPPFPMKNMPLLDPRNVLPGDACTKIIKALKSNNSLQKLHLPCSLCEVGAIKQISKALLETVSCSPSLTEVKFHHDNRMPLEKHHIAEFFETLRSEIEANRIRMKRFGHGTANLFIKVPPGAVIFERTWTELFDTPKL